MFNARQRVVRAVHRSAFTKIRRHASRKEPRLKGTFYHKDPGNPLLF
jgi:hypothetical protein